MLSARNAVNVLMLMGRGGLRRAEGLSFALRELGLSLHGGPKVPPWRVEGHEKKAMAPALPPWQKLLGRRRPEHHRPPGCQPPIEDAEGKVDTR